MPIEARELEGTNGPAQTSKGHVHVTVDAVEGAPAQVYSYDANGNMLTDGVRTYEWDAENRLVRVSWSTEGAAHTSDFVYDGMSRRVGIIDDGNHRGFVWDGLRIVEERSANGTLVKRFWGSGEERAGAEPVKLCYTRDHLGSIREMVDGSGAVRARYTYDEWGQRTKLEGDLDGDFGFTGHFEHGGSGITLAPYRGYRWDMGRWLSRDPIAEDGGINLYSYVENDPIDLIDPDGLRPLWPWQSTVKVSGGTYKERQRVRKDVKRVLDTPRGKRLEDMVRKRGEAIDLKLNNTQDHWGELGGSRMSIDPNDHPVVETTKGPQPASTARTFGHELGYCATGTADDGPNRMNNVRQNENPIVNALGEPSRTKY